MGIHILLRVLALGAKFLPIFIFTSVTIISTSVTLKNYNRFRSRSTHPENQSDIVDPAPFRDYIIQKNSSQIRDEYQQYLAAYYEALAKTFSNNLEEEDTSTSEEDEADESEEMTYVYQPPPPQPEPPHHQDKEPEGIISDLFANLGINLKLPKLKFPTLPYISIPVPKIPKVSVLLEYPEDKKPEHHLFVMMMTNIMR